MPEKRVDHWRGRESPSSVARVAERIWRFTSPARLAADSVMLAKEFSVGRKMDVLYRFFVFNSDDAKVCLFFLFHWEIVFSDITGFSRLNSLSNIWVIRHSFEAFPRYV